MSYKKYYLYKEQISYDGGTTWQDVTPSVTTPSGDPIGTYETYEQCTGGTPPTPTACTCDAFSFSGTSEGNNTYRIEIPSGETAVTAATWNASCGLVPQDFTHTDDSGFQEIVTDGHWTFDNNLIKFTASTNSTNFVREGNMTITYSVDGVSCTKVTHLVQAAGSGIGRYKLTLNNSNTVTAACNSTSSITSGDVSSRYSGTVVTAEIGDCVKTIGEHAFRECRGLTSVTIPNSVTAIDSGAFRYCSGLTGITIPNRVTKIRNYTFQFCSGLTSIYIPDTVTSIGDYAFQRCSGLTNVTIGNAVTKIGSGAFWGCSGLTDITIPNSVTGISAQAFQDCRSLTDITIPNSVTGISAQAFQDCRSLTSCTIGNGVTAIDSGAFRYCSGLTSITVNATTPPWLGTNGPFDNTNDCPIYVPSASVNAYKTANRWSNYASRIQAIP